MTGWRLGWLVAPPAFVEVLERLAQNLFLAPPTLSQFAAFGAMTASAVPLLEARRDAFRERRDALVAALAATPLALPVKPCGAFYAYVRLPAAQHDGITVARELLEKAAVAVTPGIDFGANGTHDMLRLAYALDSQRLREGVARIAAYLAPPGKA
jgi:aspartate/methionine/tyrosine aminotransferase